MSEKENLLTVAQFAREVGYTESYIYQCLNAGTLKSVKVKVGPLARTERVRIPQSELDKLRKK